MKCNIKDCFDHEECAILDITKKLPKGARSCSYFRTQKQIDKKAKKLEVLTDLKKKRKPSS